MSGENLLGGAADTDIAAFLETCIAIKAALRTVSPCVVGLCGAQGSGKSTLAEALKHRLCARGLKTEILGLDDFYLARPQREALARDHHPLLRTRGVPGTHDVALAEKMLADFGREIDIVLPRFDKAADTRRPEAEWARRSGPFDVILFEGWIVGAKPQAQEALPEPVNALERDEDAQGQWRGWVNAKLAGDYRRLFSRLDLLVLLAAPGFDVVMAWRGQQEQELARTLAAQGKSEGIMDSKALHRFISHYQRLTEHILAEMPGRADVVIQLDTQRRVKDIQIRADLRRAIDDHTSSARLGASPP